jgi:hypothetical protein
LQHGFVQSRETDPVTVDELDRSFRSNPVFDHRYFQKNQTHAASSKGAIWISSAEMIVIQSVDSVAFFSHEKMHITHIARSRVGRYILVL